MFTSTLLSLTTDLVFIDLIKFIHLSKLNSFSLILITIPLLGVLLLATPILIEELKLPFLYNIVELISEPYFTSIM